MEIDFSRAVTQLEDMVNTFVENIPNLLVALVVFGFFYYGAKLIRRLVRRLSDQYGRQENLGIVLGRLAQWAVALLGGLVASVIIFPSISPQQLIEVLGISSIAIGFAFRDILQNFLAGILILLSDPFSIGDQIVVGEFEGTVEEIQTRATMIKTYDSRRVVIPNSDLFTKTVTVNTAYARRRIQYDVGIGYGDDIGLAKRLVLEALQGIEEIMTDPPPEVIVVGLADFSVTLRVRWWVAPALRAEAVDTQDKVLKVVKETLLAHGIDLPFPTQHVLFHDQTEETDGDRARQREGWPADNGATPRPRGIAGALRELARVGGQGEK